MIRISVLITLLLGILLNSCEFRQVQTEVEEIDSLVSDTNANAEVLIFPIQLCVDSSLDRLSQESHLKHSLSYFQMNLNLIPLMTQ